MSRPLVLLFLFLASTARAEPLNVFVSILPQKYFVERIGGAQVRVTVLVGPGQSPETYEPTSRQMLALSQARIYFSIGGLSFERAWQALIQSANPSIRSVRTDSGIALRQWKNTEESEQGHDDHDHGPVDPHIWLAPPLALKMAATMRDALQQADPGHHEAYAQGHAALAAELEALDAELRALLAPAQGSRFMVFHPAWGYFADAYGLQQITIEDQGKEPGPKTLAGLIEIARKADIQVIFVQKQFAKKTARAIAEAIGAQLLEADPLAENYSANLRRTAELFLGGARR